MRTTLFIATLLGLLFSARGARAQADRSTLSVADRTSLSVADRTSLSLADRTSLSVADRTSLSLGRGAPSFVELHSRMVMHAFLRFSPERGIEQQQNALEVLRDRDRLALFGAPNQSQAGYGVALFSAVTILAAHAPGRLRALFDGPVHLGPAVFDGGGLGAGVGGRI